MVNKKYPKWLEDKNIITKDLYGLLFRIIALLLLCFLLIFYPIFCMFVNYKMVRKDVVGMFKFILSGEINEKI